MCTILVSFASRGVLRNRSINLACGKVPPWMACRTCQLICVCPLDKHYSYIVTMSCEMRSAHAD